MAPPQERRHAPPSQYMQNVASGVTVALLLWVVNTVDAMRQEITRVGVVVAEHSRTIDRHERVISGPVLRGTDRTNE